MLFFRKVGSAFRQHALGFGSVAMCDEPALQLVDGRVPDTLADDDQPVIKASIRQVKDRGIDGTLRLESLRAMAGKYEKAA